MEVVKKLGPDALIISTSKRGNKVEIEATNNFSRQRNHGDNQNDFSDILHSKIEVLRKKQRNRIYNKGYGDEENLDHLTLQLIQISVGNPRG